MSNILTSATAQLEAAGIENPRLDARVLLAFATSSSPDEMLLHASQKISAAEIKSFEAFLQRRLVGEPISRIQGEREFWGQSFKLSAHTLDPRPDSETLVDTVRSLANEWTLPPQTILDLGTGTGCLLLALLLEFPNASGMGVDISPEAVQTAQDNANSLGMTGRATFKVGDWTSDVDGIFDVIVCNPPYVRTGDIDTLQPEVRLFDPIKALDDGNDGLSCYRSLLRGCGDHLRTGGLMVLEISDDLAGDVKALIRSNGFIRIEAHRDLASHVRCLSFSSA